mgnify:CR=1 FL=1
MLALTTRKGRRASFDVIGETLRRTTLGSLAEGDEVTLRWKVSNATTVALLYLLIVLAAAALADLTSGIVVAVASSGGVVRCDACGRHVVGPVSAGDGLVLDEAGRHVLETADKLTQARRLVAHIAEFRRVLDKGEPKYLNSPETPVFHKGRVLYGLAQATRAAREGECNHGEHDPNVNAGATCA